MSTTMTTARAAPSSGRRDAVSSILHDVDDGRHELAVDFPITIDSHQSDFGPSCFEEGWKHQLPPLVVNHDQSQVIGRAIRAESLPDAHRLIGKFADFNEVPAARVAFSLIRDEIYPGFSFAFSQGVATPHPSGQRSAIRYRSAKMLEYGPVLTPSIPNTRVVGLRSANGTRSDVATDLRALFTRMEINAASDRSQAMLRQQLGRTGRLPAGVRTAVYDAFTRSEERFGDLIEEVEAAFERAERHRRDRSR